MKKSDLRILKRMCWFSMILGILFLVIALCLNNGIAKVVAFLALCCFLNCEFSIFWINKYEVSK